MLGFQRKGLQDEQIQRPLRKVDTVRVGHALPFRFYKEHIRSLGEVQGELGASPRESWDETLLSDRSCVVRKGRGTAVDLDRKWTSFRTAVPMPGLRKSNSSPRLQKCEQTVRHDAEDRGLLS